jgi:hypothetical protein
MYILPYYRCLEQRRKGNRLIFSLISMFPSFNTLITTESINCVILAICSQFDEVIFQITSTKFRSNLAQILASQSHNRSMLATDRFSPLAPTHKRQPVCLED